jgi:hypothetical protein
MARVWINGAAMTALGRSAHSLPDLMADAARAARVFKGRSRETTD